MTRPWAAVVDFDGTLVTQDLGDLVAIELGGRAEWQQAEDEYKAGVIGFRLLLERIFAPVRHSHDEIAAFARARGTFRHGFAAFAARCHETARPLVVCSAGLDVYIHPVLERLPEPVRAHTVVRANRAVCSPEGMRLEFPGAGRGCAECGSCKAPVVEELQAAGWKVAYVGDGTSDRCAARVADLVFARGSLSPWCDAQQLPHLPYDSFDDVVAAWPGEW